MRTILMVSLVAAFSAFVTPVASIEYTRIVVPIGAGTSADTTTRVFAEAFAKRLGTSAFVENYPGAGGILGAKRFLDMARGAPLDGSLLLVLTSSSSAGVALMKEEPYDPRTAFAPIGTFNRTCLVLVTRAGLKDATELRLKHKGGEVAVQAPDDLRGFIAIAKQYPHALNYGTGSNVADIAAYEFLNAAGIDMQQIPYHNKSGEPAILQDLLRGDLHAAVMTASIVRGSVVQGNIRLLAVTTAKRCGLFPEAPTLQEFGLPAVDVAPMLVLVAPADTPEQVLHRLRTAFDEAVHDPDTRNALRKMGADPDTAMGWRTTQEAIAREYGLWKEVVKRLGIKQN